MFFRSRYCDYYCWHHHRRLSFRRGMAAMLILAAVVYGLLHAPHHLDQHRSGSTPGASSHRKAQRRHHPDHHQRGTSRSHAPEHRAGQHHAKPTRRHLDHPKPTPSHSQHPSRHRVVSSPKPAPSPRALTWTNFHGLALPTSATAGPRDTRNGLAKGFADSRQGAVLAAINIAVRTAPQWGPAIFRPTIARQVVGANAAKLLSADTRAYASLHGQPADPPDAVEQAYRFVSYSPSAAVIDLVTSGNTASGAPVMTRTRLHVVWLRHDWRLQAPPNGDWTSAAHSISSLAGYTIFPGER